jgi:hypothetical protein
VNDAELRARLWASTEIDPTTGCWLWTGPRDRNGYGKTTDPTSGDRTVQVHRLGALLVGQPFDHDLTLDHLCSVRHCWNPAHLDPCTMRTNVLRGAGPTAINAAKTHCINGHELTPDNIRKRTGKRATHRECLTCHREYQARREAS